MVSPASDVMLLVNGELRVARVEPRRTLLGVLREELALTGAKSVCEMGDCGACTVDLDGQPVYSCLILAVECDGHRIRTVEGLARAGGDGAETLDPVQQAFVECDALQCGFCTPGQIMSLRTLLDANTTPSDEEIRRAISGNLCRCGAYEHIVQAGHRAVELEAGR